MDEDIFADGGVHVHLPARMTGSADRRFRVRKRGYLRSAAARLIESGDVLLNGSACAKNARISERDSVSVTLSAPEDIEARPEDIRLTWFTRTRILSSAQTRRNGRSSRAGKSGRTLVNALLFTAAEPYRNRRKIRPGIVHRIDKDTAGLIVAAKNDAAHTGLPPLKTHEIKRTYFAVAIGISKRTAAQSMRPSTSSDRPQKVAVIRDPEKESGCRHA
jgi:23S rRNA pseudouridine1911/1915/1917 synthase